MMRKIKHKPSAAWRLVFSVLVLVSILGCGKKGPPVAPRQPTMAAITDLTAIRGDGRILLGWHHAGTAAPTVAYVVLQAQRDASQAECPGCPLVFERLGTVTLQRALRRQRHKLNFETIAAKGVVYHFKVVPTQSSGAQGPDSNLVRVEIE